MSEEKITGLEFLKDIPKTNDLVSVYGSVNLEQLNNAIKRLKKIPNYDELLKENNNLQQENKKLKELTDKYEEEHKTTFETWLKEINILTELEEWLCGEKIVVYNVDGKVGILRGDILNKIQELKEKYSVGDKENE